MLWRSNSTFAFSPKLFSWEKLCKTGWVSSEKWEEVERLERIDGFTGRKDRTIYVSIVSQLSRDFMSYVWHFKQQEFRNKQIARKKRSRFKFSIEGLSFVCLLLKVILYSVKNFHKINVYNEGI